MVNVPSAGAVEAMGAAGVVNVEAIGGQVLLMPMTWVIMEFGKFSVVKAMGKYQRESLVLVEVVVAGDDAAVVDSQQLGEGTLGSLGLTTVRKL